MMTLTLNRIFLSFTLFRREIFSAWRFQNMSSYYIFATWQYQLSQHAIASPYRFNIMDFFISSFLYLCTRVIPQKHAKTCKNYQCLILLLWLYILDACYRMIDAYTSKYQLFIARRFNLAFAAIYIYRYHYAVYSYTFCWSVFKRIECAEVKGKRFTLSFILDI